MNEDPGLAEANKVAEEQASPAQTEAVESLAKGGEPAVESPTGEAGEAGDSSDGECEPKCCDDYKERARCEHEELDQRTTALDAFIRSDKFSDVPEVEQGRMTAQLKAMRTYRHVLGLRIANFTKD